MTEGANRRERRAREAQERRGDTMGKTFQLGTMPESIQQHPAFQAGQRAAESNELPPGYVQAIEVRDGGYDHEPPTEAQKQELVELLVGDKGGEN